MLGLAGVWGGHGGSAEPQPAGPAMGMRGLRYTSILLRRCQSSRDAHGCTWGWWCLSSALLVRTQR